MKNVLRNLSLNSVYLGFSTSEGRNRGRNERVLVKSPPPQTMDNIKIEKQKDMIRLKTKVKILWPPKGREMKNCVMI